MSRINKFNREFTQFKKHPYFSDIRDLYSKNIIKNIASANKFFESIKVTKKGTISKNSTSAVAKLQNLKNSIPIIVTGKDIMEWTNQFLPYAEKYDLTNPFSYPLLIHIWIYFYSKNFIGNYQFNLRYRNSLGLVPEFDFEAEDNLMSQEQIQQEYLSRPLDQLHQFDINTIGLSRKQYERLFIAHEYDFFFASAESRFKLNDKLFIVKGSSVTPQYAKQYFKDSVNEHCFLSPILRWAEKKAENSVADSTKKKYNSIINKINNKWFPQFALGFDESYINEFVNDININISVDFPFGNKEFKLQSYKSDQKAIREFRFINTRFNHVDLVNEIDFDLNETVCNSCKLIDTIELNNVDMDDKFAELNEKNIFFQYMQFGNNITLIRTPSEVFKLKSEENDIISKFELSIGVHSFTYDYIKNFDLCDFISKGVHYTNAFQRIKENNQNLKIKNLDQEKAYSQFKKCPYYMGFLGKITDFRKCSDVNFAINNIGMYQINNIVLSDKINKINMNIFVNNNIYTSPELKFLVENGCKFSVICGCWGSSFDFDFPTDMFKKFNGISLYAKWTGKCDSYNEYNTFIMKGEQELFENLKYYHNDLKIDMFGDKAAIGYKKNNISYKGHLTAFITAYQRLNMLEQVLKMDIDKIIRVVTDGIYYYDHKFEILDSFRNKNFEMKNVFTYAGDRLVSNIYTEEEELEFSCGDFLDHNLKMLYLGAGGTGKTHINLIDKGFTRKLYIAPSWKLATNKHNEYNIDSSVLARMLCQSDEANYYRNKFDVFIFDECSQYNQEDKQKIFDLFVNCKIILCGDIGYQLPPVKGAIMDKEGFDLVKEFNTVYRFEDTRLSKICVDIRNKIDKITKCPQGLRVQFYKKLNDYIIELFSDRLISFDQVKDLYTIEDYVLVSKNKCNVHHKFECNCDGKNYALQYTNLLREAGEKYIIKKNSNTHNNGDIVFQKVQNSLEAHAFSIHSIQGETIKSKIFIDLRKMFEPQMLYTAISRAKNCSQLYFIVDAEDKPTNSATEKVCKFKSEKVKSIFSLNCDQLEEEAFLSCGINYQRFKIDPQYRKGKFEANKEKISAVLELQSIIVQNKKVIYNIAKLFRN